MSGLKIAPRIKISVWRALNDIIPTKINLNKHGIVTNPLCCFCRKNVETTTHILWQCKFSLKIWEIFFPDLVHLISGCRREGTPQDLWNLSIKNLNKEETGKAAIIIWNLWSYQNKQVIEGDPKANIEGVLISINKTIGEQLKIEDTNLSRSTTENRRVMYGDRRRIKIGN